MHSQLRIGNIVATFSVKAPWRKLDRELWPTGNSRETRENVRAHEACGLGNYYTAWAQFLPQIGLEACTSHR